jgi:transcriptional regulator with XRE-family HTH domain
MYTQRLRRNIRKVIEEHGHSVKAKDRTLTSVSPRHIWNIERGLTNPSVQKLEEIADEIGADFLEFFRE